MFAPRIRTTAIDRPTGRIVRSFSLRAAVLLCAAAPLCASLAPPPLSAQSLRGSRTSLDIQNEMAKAHEFTYLMKRSDLEKFVRLGLLTRLEPNQDFELHEVSYPYTRPETALFVKRLAARYHAACGEPMVVTSLTRPESEQPPNASDRSVHPTGMALDLRLPRTLECRRWLEGVLLDLEQSRVIEATRERRPAHYHVAVFPDPYKRWIQGLGTSVLVTRNAAPKPRPTGTGKAAVRYQVRSGDSLWNIARKHGTTVAMLRTENELGSSRIRAGQVIEVPATR